MMHLGVGLRLTSHELEGHGDALLIVGHVCGIEIGLRRGLVGLLVLNEV